MQVQTQGIHRLFCTMTLVLFAGLFGMAAIEMVLLQPLSQSIGGSVVAE